MTVFFSEQNGAANPRKWIATVMWTVTAGHEQEGAVEVYAQVARGTRVVGWDLGWDLGM